MVAVVLAGCAKPRASEAPDPSLPAEPRSPTITAPRQGDPAGVPLDLSLELASIEQNLIDLDFAMRFDIESKGSVASRLVGELRLQENTLRVRASGSFGGEPVELSLQADGKRLRGTNGRSEISIPQPPELERAVVIGLVRMGLLHNLAMLVGGGPPDHADGGVDTWVTTTEVRFGAKVGPAEAGSRAERTTPEAMSFRIHVGGSEAGEATLWWDTALDVPIERHQIVRFPEGEMRVRESYSVEILRREG